MSTRRTGLRRSGRAGRSTERPARRVSGRGRRAPHRPFFDLAAGVRGDEARRLLAPIPLEEFVADYWGERPLHIRGGADKYAGFFSREELFATLTAARAPANPTRDGSLLDVRAFFDRVPGSPKVSIAWDQVEPMFRAGATICANAISAVNTKLATFAAAVKSQLSYPGLVRFNCYYSPDGCGFRRHFDARIATTLQIEGAKRWRYSKRPVVAWPRGNAVVTADGAPVYVAESAAEDWQPIPPIDEDEFEEVVLQPGDLLVLPAGTWHECNADGASLALNLAFEPQTFTELLSLTMEEELLADAGLRSAPPMIADRPGTSPFDADWSRYVRAGLERARSAIDALLADDQPMRRTWRRLVAGQYRGHSLPPTPAAPGPTARSDVFSRSRALPCSTELGRGPEGESMTLWIGEAEVEVTGAPEIALVSRVLRQGTFTAGDCLTWRGVRGNLSWNAVAEMLSMLAAAGLLRKGRESARLPARR